MKHFIEIVQDFDGSYYANVTRGGTDFNGTYHNLETISIQEYTDYNTFRKNIRDATGVEIPRRKHLVFQQLHRKKYAYIDATQPNPNGCIVTLRDMVNGHKPNFA